MSDHLIAQHTPFTSDQWAERWQQEADARNALFLEKKQLERELAASQAGQAELLARLQERTESHLAASARDVQTIQRQSVLLDRLAKAAKSYMDECPADADETTYFWAAGLSLTEALAAYEAAKAGGLPGPAAEAVKPCDWKEDEDGNWYTACHQFMCFEHAPPNEQGYKFCHRCGHPINFIEFAPPLDEPPGPA